MGITELVPEEASWVSQKRSGTEGKNGQDGRGQPAEINWATAAAVAKVLCAEAPRQRGMAAGRGPAHSVMHRALLSRGQGSKSDMQQT
jgi:hypothetical protein